jgi:hypothetical protein
MKRVLAIGAIGSIVALGARRRRAAARSQLEKQPADIGFMYAMHAAFRRDLERLRRATDFGSPRVRAGWDLLRRQLENHHKAEDDDLWPALRRKTQDPAIEAMVREHAAIPSALAAVEVSLEENKPPQAAIAELCQRVLDHLEHEEDDVLPLVAKYLNAAEWRVFLMTERRKQRPPQRVEFLAWVLDEAEPENAAAVLRELPPPGRVVYRRILAPLHRRRHLWDTGDAELREQPFELAAH